MVLSTIQARILFDRYQGYLRPVKESVKKVSKNAASRKRPVIQEDIGIVSQTVNELDTTIQ
jgi:hypothetical protein